MALLAFLLCACTTPAVRNDVFAAANDFTQQIVSGTDFSHRVYVAENPVDERADEKADGLAVWHVYIDGDGKPWTLRHVMATDPTPAEPLLLQLMAQDTTQPALYLGRPCYHGMASEAACNPWLWTYGRYSEPVVESLHVALASLIDEYDIGALVLIGHSGGGTLAMLLAERISQVRAVVTLAGNLDVDAWASLHDYTGMEYSLNPARRPPLPSQIHQLHFIGRDDSNVPPDMLKAAVKQQKNAEVFVLEDVQHRKVWNKHWKEILIKISALGGDNE